MHVVVTAAERELWLISNGSTGYGTGFTGIFEHMIPLSFFSEDEQGRGAGYIRPLVASLDWSGGFTGHFDDTHSSHFKPGGLFLRLV